MATREPVTHIRPAKVRKLAALLGVNAETKWVGLIEREARSRGHAPIVCECGGGTEPNEPPASGLYVDNDDSIRRVCGSCWLEL